jgi:hypothetical protein
MLIAHIKNSGQTKFRECLMPYGPKSLLSSLLYKNIKIKIYRTVILPDVYGMKLGL